jgi:hypothetical protein
VGLGFNVVPLDEFKVRKVGKPPGWTRGMSARRLLGAARRLKFRED